MSCVVLAFCATAVHLPAQILTTLYSLDGADGATPYAAVVLATDGNLYGTTLQGGASGNCSGGCGTVFKTTPSGTLTTVYSFSGPDGSNPYAGLIQATDGNFYGTTSAGGSTGCGGTGCGAVFKITASGTLTTLHIFGGSDGFFPVAGLVQTTDGNFYGTTVAGGASSSGTVFKITPSGTLTTLYSFCSQNNCADGAYPQDRLLQATDGNFYGTTYNGGSGSNCCGTVFRITPSGALTTLYSWTGTDGAYPYAGLVQAKDGNFYGTTYAGGANQEGTVFKITPSG